MQSILGQDYEAHFVEAPLEMEPEEDLSISENITMANKSQSLDTYNRISSERYDVLRGYHQQRGDHADSTHTNPDAMDTGSIRGVKRTGPGEPDELQNVSTPLSALSRSNSTATKRSVEGTRGHARDPLEEQFPFLHIGPSTYTGSSSVEDSEMSEPEPAPIFDELESTLASEPLDTHMTEDDDGPVPIVSESPGAAEFDIYETAYRLQIERIRDRAIPRRGTAPKMYLTRRVDGKDDMKRLVQEEDVSNPKSKTTPAIGNKMAVTSSSSFGSAVGMIRAQLEEQKENQQEQEEQEQSQTQTETQTETQTQAPETTATSQSEQPTSEQPSTSENPNKENQPSPPENPRSKLRCLMGRIRGS